jgi:hypothetical protein
MKIKDILGEDGVTVTGIDSSSGKAKLSTGQEIDAKTLTPDEKHPGQYTMPSMDPTSIKPGSVVTPSSETSEDITNDPVAQQYVQQLNQLMQHASQPWEKAQLAVRLQAVQQGDVPHDARGGAIKVLPPAEWEAKTDPKIVLRMMGVNGEGLSPEYKQKMGGWLSQQATKIGFEEGKKHKDTIADGGGDVGGDATDNFIDDVKDKEFERKNRGQGTSARSPIGGKLKEGDELYHWLTIAGIK